MKLAILLLAALAVTLPARGGDAVVDRVTMVQLLAHPDKYDGKRVAVIGYLHLQFEGNALWLHKEDFDHEIIPNMLSVVVTEDMKKWQSALTDKYVMIVGTFDAKDLGHMSLCAGGLKDIKTCAVWSERRQAKPAGPHGSADRSQLFRSKTNQVSGAAGSGRRPVRLA